MGPDYNLSWFRLTPEAIKLNHEEQCVYRDFKDHLEQRLVKFVLMSVENTLPFKKVHKAFERHPHVFYLSLRNNTCTAILKEAYFDEMAIEAHPLAELRKKYINLVKESKVILKNRRLRNQSFWSGDGNSMMELDGGDTHDG
ncbi:root primordium defective 1-like protein, partial [Tanacetum coccineum]